MIRVSKHTLKFSNKEKLEKLDKFFKLFKDAVAYYIELIKAGKLPLKVFLSTADCPDCCIKHSRYKQLAYKVASEIVRSNLKYVQNKVYSKYRKLYSKCLIRGIHQRFTERHFKELNINYLKRVNIDLKNISIPLNENLFDVEQTSGEFNEFVRIFLPWFKEGKKRAETIKLPIKWHRHSLKFKDWNRRKTVQLEMKNGKMIICLFWEKEAEIEEHKQKIGIDQGYRKLISDSNGVHWGSNLKEVYEKLAKKQRGSKKYKRLLEFKRQKINQTVNQFVQAYPDTDIICEDLKNVKYASQFYRKVNNKLQYWSYRQVLDKLENLSELKGFKLIKVEPTYTSQTCSRCGTTMKVNRDGEHYHCDCGLEIDADTNAAINILHRGVYCPSTQRT